MSRHSTSLLPALQLLSRIAPVRQVLEGGVDGVIGGLRWKETYVKRMPAALDEMERVWRCFESNLLSEPPLHKATSLAGAAARSRFKEDAQQ